MTGQRIQDKIQNMKEEIQNFDYLYQKSIEDIEK